MTKKHRFVDHPSSHPKDSLLYGLRDKMTDDQRSFGDSILENDITFSNSPSGSGKTTLAVAYGKMLVESHMLNRIIYLFSPIQEGAMGFRPGDQAEKNAVYLDPLFDALKECNTPTYGGRLPEWVIACPHTFLRGVNFQKAFIILDEAQNYTKPELKKILTRIHTNENACKTVVLGHTGQIDLKRPQDSGFASCIEHFSTDPRTGIVTLSKKNFRGWISEHADNW